jgi:transposase
MSKRIKMYLTYRFRLKDRRLKELKRQAGAVNFVWNYCNDVMRRRWKESRKYTNDSDLHKLTTGSSKELGLHSQTITILHEELCQKTSQFKKPLRWRSGKKNLGWIPLNGQAIKLDKDRIIFMKRTYPFWKSRDIPEGGQVKSGSFSEDSLGHWYVNLVVKLPEEQFYQEPAKTSEVGIDPGLKTVMTLSTGEKFERDNLTKEYAIKLARAQRRGKKRQVKKIHAKIKNKRLDFAHKASNKLAKEHSVIFFGNVKSAKLAKTKMASGVYDAGWHQIKTLLAYKTIRRQGMLVVQNEQNSTVTCSGCLSKTGPSGLSGLKVREWQCKVCGSVHDRDVNAAKNILRLGQETLRAGLNQPKGDPQKRKRTRCKRPANAV